MEIGIISVIIHTHVGKTASDRAKPSVRHAKRKPTRLMPNMSANTDEVSKHVLDSDCWVIIGEDVYDVTKFLPDHPGGKKAIILLARKEEQKSSTCYTIARLSKSMGLIKAQLPIRVSYPSE